MRHTQGQKNLLQDKKFYRKRRREKNEVDFRTPYPLDWQKCAPEFSQKLNETESERSRSRKKNSDFFLFYFKKEKDLNLEKKQKKNFGGKLSP